MAENGFLTNTDKAFLRGEKEYETKQGRYDRRRAIAERTRQAFRDFALLCDELNEDERNRIFDVGPTESAPTEKALQAGFAKAFGDNDGVEELPGEEELREYREEYEARANLREGVVGTLGFLYLALEGPADRPIPQQRGFRYRFSQVLDGAVRWAENERRQGDIPPAVVDVTFDVDVYNPELDYEYAVEKFARGQQNELSDREIRSLLTGLTSDLGVLSEWRGLDDLHSFADRVEERRAEIEERGDLDPTSSDTDGADE